MQDDMTIGEGEVQWEELTNKKVDEKIYPFRRCLVPISSKKFWIWSIILHNRTKLHAIFLAK